MSTRHRVMIVEDHALLRAGLLALLARAPDIEVVGEADNGREAVRIAGALSPHLVLTDVTMPGRNGIAVIADLKRRFPAIKVLVLTIHRSEEYIQECLGAGADGYLLRGASAEELYLAVRTILMGKSYLTPDIADRVINGFLCAGREDSSGWNRLTRRELQVLKLVAEGKANKSIAEYLCLSVKTVEKHRANLMSKLDIHNASTLTGFAIKRGLVADYGDHLSAPAHG